MRRKVSETATPPSSAPTLNAAALTRLDDPTCREAIARVALSGRGVATLREAQAELQPDYPDNANKLNELINALEAVTTALSAGAAWAQVGGFVFVDGRDVTPMFGTVQIGDKATVYWRECGEALSLFVARADGLSALAFLHARQPRGANTRRDPILPRITIDAPDLARERGELIVAPEGRAGLRTARMPLFPDALHDDVHVPLLDLADVATGERAVSTGRGAAHELRLLFEGVTGIGVAARAGYGELIAWTVGELLEAFYRGGGKVRRSGERPGDWELIRRACRWISGAAIPWRVPSGNAQPWAIMTLRSLPGERPALSDPVVFDVRLPPGAGPGPAVDRPALREAGRVSSPAFRIGVAVPSATWMPGRTRRPVRGVGGLWIGDASRYPVFSARDRRRIAFGPESTHRPGWIDDAWHKSADAAGVVILDTEAVDRDGKRGWIVVPAAAAKAIRKATK